MQILECEKHQLKKDFVFCLNSRCNDRLVCVKCYVLDKKHDNHRLIILKPFMDGDENEVNRIFNDEYLKNIKENMNAQQFIEQFDNEFNKYLDEKEEQLRTPFEQMIASYRASLEKAKQNIYDRFKVKEVKTIQEIKQNIKDLIENDNSQDKQKAVKDQIDSCNQIDQIKKILEQIMEQLEQYNQQAIKNSQKIFETLTQEQAKICAEYSDTNLWYVRQLKQSNNSIQIRFPNKLDEYRNQIRQMEEEKKQYYIYLGFGYNDNTSLEFKQQVMNMIDELGVNHKVGEVYFSLNNNTNKFNADLIMKMNSNYRNLWYIYIIDHSNQVDNNMYDQFKIMVTNSTVLKFTLHFGQPVYLSDQALKLLKEYNQIMKTKTHLEYLHYCHQKMHNHSSADKQDVRWMIETISNV